MKEITARVKNKYHSFMRYLRWWKYMRLPIGRKIYLIGTPIHSNIGDSAIALAEKALLTGILKKNRVKEITYEEFLNNQTVISKLIRSKRLICGMGGGNFGNLWYEEECIRYRLIDSFPNNPIVIFPQTVYFSKDEKGRKAIEESKRHYEKPNHLTIVARDKTSFELLKELYHKPAKMLTPDIVLSSTMDDYGVVSRRRSGGLLVFRNDAEKAMTDQERQIITDYLNINDIPFRTTDMYSDEQVSKKNRKQLVRKKMQEFADAEFVITDRLHGMIFAAITGTPCIVFSNNHHKITEAYEWISYLEYICYADKIEEAISVLPKLIRMKKDEFDNKPLINRFELLVEDIKKNVN